jgi:hypothetical protein
MIRADASGNGQVPRGERVPDDDDDTGERGSDPSSRANLRPWRKGDPRTVDAARKGGQTRAANAAARRAAALGPVAALEAVADRFSRDQLGTMAAAVAMWTMGEVVAGRQKVRDPAAWVRVLVDVARLEAGEVTAATASVHVTPGDLARALELRDMARRAIAEPLED